MKPIKDRVYINDYSSSDCSDYTEFDVDDIYVDSCCYRFFLIYFY